MKRPFCEEILSYLSDMWIVDTHEHIAVHKSTSHPDSLKTTVNTYARMDLHSAGMSAWRRRYMESTASAVKP